MSNMEWIETTGKTVEEAREHALDQLRVDESEVEFETIEEPRAGFFGRTRGVARVRARVAHKVPRPKTERRKRPKKSSDNEDGQKNGNGSKGSKDSARTGSNGKGEGQRSRGRTGSDQRAGSTDGNKAKASEKMSGGNSERRNDVDNGNGQRSRPSREPMDEARQIEVVEQFLSGVLDSFGLRGSFESEIDGKDLVTNVTGDGLGLLVGPRLATLEALQELARLSLQREADGKEYARVTVDVAGIRDSRRESLDAFVRSAAERVIDEGHTIVFEEMSSADRKQVHDLAAGIEGVRSVSEGEDPRRRVALVPAD